MSAVDLTESSAPWPVTVDSRTSRKNNWITYLLQWERKCHSLLVRQWSMQRDSEPKLTWQELPKCPYSIDTSTGLKHQPPLDRVLSCSFVSLPFELCADTRRWCHRWLEHWCFTSLSQPSAMPQCTSWLCLSVLGMNEGYLTDFCTIV